MTLATVDRFDPAGLSTVGDRAVVVGGSMAGLSTARVLADGFEEVVVIERDPLPDEPDAAMAGRQRVRCPTGRPRSGRWPRRGGIRDRRGQRLLLEQLDDVVREYAATLGSGNTG